MHTIFGRNFPLRSSVLGVVVTVAALATWGCPSDDKKGEGDAGSGGAMNTAATPSNPSPPGPRGSGSGMSAEERDKQFAALKAGRADFEKNMAERRKERAEEEERSRKELAEEDAKTREELAAIEKLPADQRAAKMKEREARLKKIEWNNDGLILKLDSLKGTRNSITGVIVNRRKDTVDQATVTFDLFDSDNAPIGTASATIDDFKPNTKWYFTVNTLGKEVVGFKPKGLSGF